MRQGWYLIAFDREVAGDLTTLEVIEPMIALRTRKGIRVFDAICPHRGAHLGFGGRPDGDAIICPFHGKRIGLGACDQGYVVREYPTLTAGGMVFVQVPGADCGFRDFMKKLDAQNYLIAGFRLDIAITSETVIENAFDATHFQPVHSVHNMPILTHVSSEHGEFAARSAMTVPLSQWQRGAAEHNRLSVPYIARAFGGGIVVSHMGGSDPYWVITGATPTGPCQCTIRVSIAVPPNSGDGTPDEDRCAYLLRQVQLGIEQDRTIWENMQPGFKDRLGVEDRMVADFRSYLQAIEREGT